MHEDTIAAISTPIGEGGVGIVRLSGPEAIAIADGVFVSPKGSRLTDAPTHTIHYGHVVDDGRRIDEVLASVMRAPRTYTREDVVEIGCHGGIVATRAVLDAVLARGARLAERGEFTKRAYLNGRISLDQAQAVADVVCAQTRLGLEAAVDRLGGRFSSAIAALRDELAALLADLEVDIDFPDLDVVVDELLPRAEAIEARAADLLARAERGAVVREGLTVAIVGRPNVGKSTLLNALLAEERSIVTPVPGTTRDTVEEVVSIGGVPVRLIDTAGLRTPTDLIEAEGVRRTREATKKSDLVLLLVDRSKPLADEDRDLIRTEWGVPVLLVLNKSDLPAHVGDVPRGTSIDRIEISAKDGANLPALTGCLVELLLGGEIPSRNTILLLDTWERDLLRRLRDGVARSIAAMREGLTPDMVAEELRSAYVASGDLQGIDVSESILDAIFSRFCVGK
ncbi:MAG: tRNA uridine-5-carboxymethylaminomethyl(34) synthesis GTPase MnmE [Candidatus Bipolaricaulota bacterium]|nr:tRNA uridine-5-carboxymethylaminomethyl(34) synthesis GTPase MnmE [Candidatus Bipolaricaulota bacterium]